VEKISGIIRGNSRTSTVDLRSSGATRPGAPSFGGPVGVSTNQVPRFSSTPPMASELPGQMDDTGMTAVEIANSELSSASDVTPKGYHPRGSYIDVQA